MAWFLRGSPSYPVAWSITAIALRKVQDVGAHRKKMYREKPSMERELWKRSCWILIIFDIYSALSLGRSVCINKEEWVFNTAPCCKQKLNLIVTIWTYHSRLTTSIGKPATPQKPSDSL
jgi:hypothetical protein